jgi:indole-3-glycerol phosphate synthase/phosphoribosylanthranilate isomerase
VTLVEALSVKQGCDLSFAGVFVNQPASLIADYAKQLDLKAVQLHGEESARDIRELRAMLTQGVEIWKAVRVKDAIPVPADFGCDRILLDAFAHDKRGGTGQQFDWGKLAHLPGDSYILSGGLSPKNAREADARNLWALDVNSGVESAPGIKNEQMLTAFFEELR